METLKRGTLKGGSAGGLCGRAQGSLARCEPRARELRHAGQGLLQHPHRTLGRATKTSSEASRTPPASCTSHKYSFSGSWPSVKIHIRKSSAAQLSTA